jgi:putative ABC transport system permease protein
VLVTITQIDGNLRRQFLAALPDHAPSFYFIDIPATEADRFNAFLKKTAPDSTVEEVPMLRGRIVSARGVRAEELKPSTDSEWVLQSDRGLTSTGEIPKGSKIVEGEWWGADYDGPPLISIEKKIAEGLKLKIGDEIIVNVLGRDIVARIANMRTIDWQGLGINFVLVFSPNAFKGAPHTHIATLTEAHPDSTADGDECAGSRSPGNRGHRDHQSRAGDSGRERRHPDLGRAGARRRTRGRPSPQGL